jgi:MtN3 and saliva related transmembrane protein
MQFDATEGLGMVAGLIGALCMLPQALKIWRTGSAEDVSWVMYLMAAVAAAMWTTYGVLRGAPSLMLWNLVSFTMATSVLVLKFRTRPR